MLSINEKTDKNTDNIISPFNFRPIVYKWRKNWANIGWSHVLRQLLRSNKITSNIFKSWSRVELDSQNDVKIQLRINVFKHCEIKQLLVQIINDNFDC